MSVVGKVFKVGAKVAGTVVVGGVGIACACLEQGFNSLLNDKGGELKSSGNYDVASAYKDGADSLSSACFSAVKKIWAGGVDDEEIVDSFEYAKSCAEYIKESKENNEEAD